VALVLLKVNTPAPASHAWPQKPGARLASAFCTMLHRPVPAGEQVEYGKAVAGSAASAEVRFAWYDVAPRKPVSMATAPSKATMKRSGTV